MATLLVSSNNALSCCSHRSVFFFGFCIICDVRRCRTRMYKSFSLVMETAIIMYTDNKITLTFIYLKLAAFLYCPGPELAPSGHTLAEKLVSARSGSTLHLLLVVKLTAQYMEIYFICNCRTKRIKCSIM